MSAWLRSRAAPILPLVLMTVALLEDVATYKVRQHVADVRVRAAVILALNGVAFGIAGGWIGPWLQRTLARVRRTGRDTAGALGLWLFYAAAYGGLYWAYLAVERHGPGALLPAHWR
ncbi:MAG TPA: hypothetical protein VL172_02480 [Kofleriaceae bacterium]|nr:hypothetical protein [Kofleriaceae bacterium]